MHIDAHAHMCTGACVPWVYVKIKKQFSGTTSLLPSRGSWESQITILRQQAFLSTKPSCHSNMSKVAWEWTQGLINEKHALRHWHIYIFLCTTFLRMEETFFRGHFMASKYTSLLLLPPMAYSIQIFGKVLELGFSFSCCCVLAFLWIFWIAVSHIHRAKSLFLINNNLTCSNSFSLKDHAFGVVA